jgi:uncharacterized protein (TIGR00730 family)
MKFSKENKLTHEEIVKNIDEQTASIAKEFRDGFTFIEKYPRSVTIFGSARALPESVHSQTAEVLAGKIVKELGYAVVTGGGPGIMSAANKGAREARGESVGISIDLLYEQATNKFVTDSIHFNYFFSRKVMLSFAAEAYVFFPGGFGTFDEFFGILTLIQNNKIPRVPIILMGRDFWAPLHEFIKISMYENHSAIAKSDMHLYHITDSIDEALGIIKKAPPSTWWEKTD